MKRFLIDKEIKNRYTTPIKKGDKMRENISIKDLIFSLIFVAALGFFNSAQAAFDLSYSLTEGGTRLEINPQNPYRGVQIEITSSTGLRYEVTHKIMQPIQNRDNPSITISNNFVFRGLRGTNTSGTFHVPSSDTPVRSGEVLYTSDTSGSSDNFTLVYGITDINNITPGYYQGQICFTLRPIGGSGVAEVNKYLYVYITVSEDEGSKASIEITTPTGAKTLSLGTKREELQSVELLVKVKGNFRKMFSLLQLMQQPLESNEGNRLDYEALNVSTRQVSKGAGISQVPLSSRPQAIYTSRPNGEADESFIVTYSLGDLSQQKAGRYKSYIQYFLDQMGTQKKLDMLGLELEIERQFDLFITPQDQMGAIEFSNLKPDEGPRTSEVIIEVKSNIAKPYQVTQFALSELTDKEGNKIEGQYFTLQTQSLDTKGTLKVAQKQEVKKQDMILFVSDKKGSADKFKVAYELTCPKDLKAGNYSTRITYSLVEL